MRNVTILLFLLIAFSIVSAKSPKLKSELIELDRQQVTSMQPQQPNYKAVLQESFEENFPPDGWTTISNGNANEEWNRTNRQARTGNYSAFIAYSSATETMDEWLVTPAIDLSGEPRARLIFFEMADSWEGYGVEHAIKVSTTSQTDVSTFKTVLSMTPTRHQIEGFDGNPVMVDLSEFAGSPTVYVAFFYRGSDADNWYVDDVEILTPSDHDAEVIQLALQDHYDVGSTISPEATVMNAGKNTESFSVEFGYFDWDENPMVLSTRTLENIEAGATQVVTFDEFTFDHEIEYHFFVRVKLDGDEDPGNDQASKVVNSFSKTKSMVLIEKGTGTWCQYCPGSAKAVELLNEDHFDSLAVLEYHSGDIFETSMSLSRINFYNITGFPTAVFGGTYVYVGGVRYNDDFMPLYYAFKGLYDTILEEKTGFSIELQLGEGRATRFPVYVHTTFEAETLLKSYRLFLGVNESHFGIQWQGMDSLHFVARSLQPRVSGIPFFEGAQPPEVGQTVSDTIDFRLPTSVVKKNCHLIAFIQNIETKEIAAVTKIDFANPPVPASVAKENTTQLWDFTLLQNYPNPFNPETWIQFNTAKTTEVELAIFNIQGQFVRTLGQREFPAGTHQIRWDGKDNFGREVTSGVYFLKATESQHAQVIKLIKMK